MNAPESLGNGDVEAFARGHAAGVIASRLAQHDAHFAVINGSIDRFAREMQAMVLGIQRLSDQAEAARLVAAATASALKDAEDTRRSQAESKFAPWSRMAVLIGALIAIMGFGATYLQFKQPTEVRIVRPDTSAPIK